MLLRIGRDRHLEIADALDPGDEFGGILVSAGMRRVGCAEAARRIAAQRHDMPDADVAIIAHHRIDFLARGIDAGQMRRRHQRGLVEHALHGRVRAFAGRTAGAIGHRHEMRMQRREPLDRVPERTLHLLGLGRKEFERHLQRLAASVHQPADPLRRCLVMQPPDVRRSAPAGPARAIATLRSFRPSRSPARCSCAW